MPCFSTHRDTARTDSRGLNGWPGFLVEHAYQNKFFAELSQLKPTAPTAYAQHRGASLATHGFASRLQEGASFIFPDTWDEYLAPIPPREHADLMGYGRAVHSPLFSPITIIDFPHLPSPWGATLPGNRTGIHAVVDMDGMSGG